MRARPRISFVLAASVALTLGASCGGPNTADLDCSEERDRRRREICYVVAEHLKLSWGGPNKAATPAYLLGGKELAGVYCDARLTIADATALAAMESERREPRLSAAAGQLRRLLAPSSEERGTRYDPEHPRYYLKEPCRPPFSARRR